MQEMAYLAAGLRIFFLVAFPVTLVVYACVAVSAASDRSRDLRQKEHRRK